MTYPTKRASRHGPSAGTPEANTNAQIGVVIAARDEEKNLPRLLGRLHDDPFVALTVVSDGGSRDQTIAVARAANALVIEGPPCRGEQLNRGARALLAHPRAHEMAGLWFLHADCAPDRGAARAIVGALRKGASGGHLRLRFAGQHPAARVFELLARAGASRGYCYGDAGLWTSLEWWRQSGGFAPWPLFEDLDFAKRTRAHGGWKSLPERVFASPRRFEHRPGRTLALWLELQTRFALGQKPHALAARYHPRREG